MAKGVIPSQEAWSSVSKATRTVLREPIEAKGATRKKIFPSSGGGTLPVRPTANAAGGGKYTGYTVAQPTGSLSASGDLAETDLGANTSTACLIYNAAESGLTTHALTAGTPVQKTFIGFYLGMSNDTPAKPVYMINGFDLGC